MCHADILIFRKQLVIIFLMCDLLAHIHLVVSVFMDLLDLNFGSLLYLFLLYRLSGPPRPLPPLGGPFSLMFSESDPYPLFFTRRTFIYQVLQGGLLCHLLAFFNFSYPQDHDSFLEVPQPLRFRLPPQDNCLPGSLFYLMTFSPSFQCWLEEALQVSRDGRPIFVAQRLGPQWI